MRFGLAILVGLGSAPAWAECPPYGVNDWIGEMDAADAAMAEFDLDQARGIVDAAEVKLNCTMDVIHPNQLTRFAKQKALLAFFDQDELAAQKWGLLAKLSGTSPWPEGMDDTHPFREMIDFAEKTPRLGPEGAGIYPPKGGAMIMNGKFLDTPKAHTEIPNFVQIFDRRGLLVESYWQDGAAFPSRYLAADPTPQLAPEWYSAPTTDLDPMKKVDIDPKVIAAREAAIAAKAAEKERAKQEQAALMAKEMAKTEKLAKKNAKKRAKEEAKEARRIAKEEAKKANSNWVDPEAPPPPPETWLDLSFNDENETLAQFENLDTSSVAIECDEYMRLEPTALMGKLDTEQIKCLEIRLRHAPRQTDRDRLSRLLMADAWAKELPHRWEAAVRRHLTEIDMSDADLCYIFARYLARQGPETTSEAIRWSEIALARAEKWRGQTRVKRVYALHRIKALAAQQRWHELESSFLAQSSRETLKNANSWRNRTKTYAREWMEFADDAGLDILIPREICESAAGTRTYCDTL